MAKCRAMLTTLTILNIVMRIRQIMGIMAMMSTMKSTMKIMKSMSTMIMNMNMKTMNMRKKEMRWKKRWKQRNLPRRMELCQLGLNFGAAFRNGRSLIPSHHQNRPVPPMRKPCSRPWLQLQPLHP